MRESLASVKIRVPQVSRILARDRLLDALDLYKEKKLVFILGQAAQGKSTLAASFVKRTSRLSAWVNLGIEESHPVNFFRLVVQAVQQAIPDLDLTEIFRYIAMDLGPRAEGPLYQGWVQAVLEKVPTPIQIVLDGLERLPPCAPSYQLIQLLLNESDSQFRFLLLSRTKPPLNIKRLQMKREAAVIGNDELAFTRSETESFFRTLHDISLPEEQLNKIYNLTEGWVGGLILFSEALKRSPDGVQHCLLSEDSITNFKEETFRYLADEVFDALREPQKDFLIKSSILEVIDHISIRDLLETGHGDALLKDLSEKNLFIQSLYDPDSGMVYRYHQVFREFLRNRFDTEISTRDQRFFFARAGHVYEQNANYENALNLYLKAGQYRKASKVLERIGTALLMSGRVADLAGWLQQLPGRLIQQSPWLLYFLCMTRRFTTAMENSHALLDCLRIFEKKDDIRGQMLATAFLIEAYALGGYHVHPIKSLVAHAEKLLENTPQDQYVYERGVLWFQLGLGMTFLCGNPRKGFWYSKKAYLLARHCGDANLQFSAMNQAVEALAWIGEFDMADELVAELETLMKASSYQELRAYHMIALAVLSMLRGEIGKAREKIRHAHALVEKHGLIYLHSIALATDMFIHVYSGELDKAMALADQLHDFALSIRNRAFEGIVLFDKGVIFYRKKEWRRAAEHFEKAMQILSSDQSLAMYHYHAAVVLQSRVRIELEDQPGDTAELEKTLDYLRSVPDYLDLIDAHICMAFIQRKHKKTIEAVYHLEEAFRLAREKKHYHSALLSREDLADACVLALALNVENATGYASYLLTEHLADLAGQRLKIEQHAAPIARARVRALIKEFHRKSLAVVRIQCLGEFNVWIGDRLVTDEQWIRLQPKLLLKSVIARGAQGVPREVVMEDLWPDNDPAASEKNFKVTLHRLRKALEPNLDKTYGSFYLHLKENKVSLDSDLIAIDIDEFTCLSKLGDEEESKKNIKKAIQHYTEAIDRYTGEFLEDDPYLVFAEVRRNEIRKTYTGVLMRLARLYEKQGKAKSAIKYCRKVIQAEPVMEEAHQKIMTLYSACGMRNAAIKAYRDFEKMLAEHCQCQPDQSTQAIYRKIVEDPPSN
ncbi:MAG: hypothetical protein VR64_02770 [Desulfatitalea sp. BRH_c12]|nr:MAG: hypothetical protein VR64_02770 [Desulfatitalea sp. BRH_c12]